MSRMQISLSDEDRPLLDRVGTRTGRSVSSLIREAVQAHWRDRLVDETDLEKVERAFGAWSGERNDGAVWVDHLRSGERSDRG